MYTAHDTVNCSYEYNCKHCRLYFRLGGNHPSCLPPNKATPQIYESNLFSPQVIAAESVLRRSTDQTHSFPNVPVDPAGLIILFPPAGPLGPTFPAGPLGPDAPAGPIGPDAPVGPFGPDAPAGPLGPVAPAGPVAEFKPKPRIRLVTTT